MRVKTDWLNSLEIGNCIPKGPGIRGLTPPARVVIAVATMAVWTLVPVDAFSEDERAVAWLTGAAKFHQEPRTGFFSETGRVRNCVRFLTRSRPTDGFRLGSIDD